MTLTYRDVHVVRHGLIEFYEAKFLPLLQPLPQ